MSRREVLTDEQYVVLADCVGCRVDVHLTPLEPTSTYWQTRYFRPVSGVLQAVSPVQIVLTLATQEADGYDGTAIIARERIASVDIHPEVTGPAQEVMRAILARYGLAGSEVSE